MKKYFCALLLVLANGIVMAQLVINTVGVESPQCHALCNGSLNISASGTSGPYQYSIDGGATYHSQNFFNSLCAGTYDIWVHDPGFSLYADTTVVMTEPALLDITSSTSSDVICNGDCNGSASVNVSGGTVSSGYMYFWTNGESTPSVNGLCPGSYECMVSDDNECYDSITLVISEPSALVFTIDAENVSCHGGNDGVINFMDGNGNSGAFGGTPFANNGYQYSIDEGGSYQSLSEFTNITAGLYGLIVEDSLGCIAYSPHDIFEPAPISFSVYSSSPSACNVADGSFTISELMQDSSYNIFYTDQNGNQSQTGGTANIDGEITVSGLSSDEISDITVGLNTCSAFMDTLIYLTAPTFGFIMNTASAVVTDASCTNTDGSITGISVSGGTGPGTYTYNYTGGAATLDLLNAYPGSYTLTVSDTNGCVIESNAFTINSTISNVTLSSATTSATCNGNCDGAISTVASGGDGNYSYTCSNGMVGDSLINVCAGIHTIWVIDGLGCQGIDTVTVLEPAVISNTISSVAPSCGSNDGSAEVTGSTGGVLPYSYQWSNGSTSELADSLLAGVYVVTVTDDALCSVSETVNITSSAGPIITSNIIDASCNGGNDGAIDLTITGGTAPYNIDWSTGEHTQDVSGLAAGIYDVTIFDDAGCGAVQVFSVLESMPIDLSVATIVDASCASADGMISVSATGGVGGYNYLWSGEESQCNYELCITDDFGDGWSGNTVDVFVNGNLYGNYGASLVGPGPECFFIAVNNGDTVDVIFNETGTYAFECNFFLTDASGSQAGFGDDISNINNVIANCGSTTSDASNLAAGTYFLSVTDNNLCTANASYTVSNAAGPSISVDQVIQPVCQGGSGEILVSVTGGALPYSYEWSNGASSEDLFNAPVGSYELVVTDSNGCKGVEYSELFGVNLNAAEICMVTVDTATGANLVVWNKEQNLGISEYEIHKETNSLNVFQLLGTVPFDSLSQFVDTAANSSVHSYRYKLRTIDSCGNYSEFLAYHKTIHLVSNIGLNNTVNLIWDDYIGFQYLTFYINRYQPTIGWEVLDSVAANIHSYTDNSFLSLAGLQYDIEAVPIMPCLAEKAQDHNSTRSNRHTIAPPSPSLIDESTMLNARVQPNPSNGFFSIIVEASNWTYSILDMNGKLIMNESASANKVEVNIEALEAGIYMLQISVEGHSVYKKILKQ